MRRIGLAVVLALGLTFAQFVPDYVKGEPL